MASNFMRTAQWLHACGKTPGRDTASTQIGCHIEEFLEFLNTLGFEGPMSGDPIHVIAGVRALTSLATDLKQGSVTAFSTAPEATLDALCDGEVTGNGIAYLLGYDKPGADQAVLSSNEAKLVDGKPVILPGGKIGKPEGWAPPNLTPFVPATKE